MATSRSTRPASGGASAGKAAAKAAKKPAASSARGASAKPAAGAASTSPRNPGVSKAKASRESKALVHAPGAHEDASAIERMVGNAAQDIGSFIRAQREAAEVSLRQLAERTGVSNPYLSQIERGLRKPSAEVLGQIAKGLRVSAEVLYMRAGILEERHEGTTRDALVTARELSDKQRIVLVEIYDSFVANNNAASGTAGGRAGKAAAAASETAGAASETAGAEGTEGDGKGAGTGAGESPNGAKPTADPADVPTPGTG